MSNGDVTRQVLTLSDCTVYTGRLCIPPQLQRLFKEVMKLNQGEEKHKAYRTTIPADCAAPAMSICQYKNTEKSNRQYRYLQKYLPRFTGISRQITDLRV